MRNSHAVMKLLTTVLLTVAAAFAQSPDRLPVPDAEKIADALRAGPAFITKDATVLVGHRQLEVNTGSFAKDRTNGPVFRLFLGLRMMRATPHSRQSQGATTRYFCGERRTALPAARRTLITSASRTCSSASGNLRKMAPPAMTSALAHT
jgi:hypothetical protein